MNAVPLRRHARSASVIWFQAGIAVASLGLLLLAPPAQGNMMLVPLTAQARVDLPALALDGGTRLIATGPLPGSLLVEGRRAALLPRLLHHATLVLASPPGGCLAGSAAGAGA